MTIFCGKLRFSASRSAYPVRHAHSWGQRLRGSISTLTLERNRALRSLLKTFLRPFTRLFRAKVRPEWGNEKSPCGNDDAVGVNASATPFDQFWSDLKAGRTGEVRQEPNVAFFRKKRQFRLIVDDRGLMLVLHTCDLNLKRIAE